MVASRAWKTYLPTYRAQEIAILADWIQSGQSGAVVGLAGAGKSNLLGFLSYRPEVLQLESGAKPTALIPVDLNNLPANNISTFYRVILRSFYEVRDRFDPTLKQTITTLYLDNRAERDPFLPQSALRELFLQFQAQNTRVVMVLDRFDHFCQVATLPMLNTLRGLRDSFKDTLCYIVGLRQEVAYLTDPTRLGELYEILDTHVCWVGPMAEPDAQQLIIQEMAHTATPPTDEEILRLLSLTGGYPALLKATCHWWLSTNDKATREEWKAALLAEKSVDFRLKEIWEGLTQEERLVLSEVQKLQMLKKKNLKKAFEDLAKQYHPALDQLVVKGLCQEQEPGWRINGDLLAAYTANVKGYVRGKIWLDEQTGELYQGQTTLEGLTHLEKAVLTFLINHPRAQHSKSVLIDNAWPEEFAREGITDDSLYQVIRKLRKNIEPNPAKPCYILTWRGQPEGGYQFFPEGQPG